MDGKGKVVIITGANAGIGKAAAVELARRGARVVIVARSRERGEKARQEVMAQSGSSSVDLMLADLSSQQSIREFAGCFLGKYDRLHVLINNAANFDWRLKQATLTAEGHEVIWATNHLGPFLMTNLLLDLMKRSAPARILNVSSKGLLVYPRLRIDFEDLNFQRKKFSSEKAYYHSKLAQVMFTYELSRRLEGSGVTANCIRVPSVKVDLDRLTDLPPLMRFAYRLKRSLAISPERMAETYAYLALAPELEGVSGKCFDEHNRPVGTSEPSMDPESARRLWEVSARLTGVPLD